MYGVKRRSNFICFSVLAPLGPFFPRRHGKGSINSKSSRQMAVPELNMALHKSYIECPKARVRLNANCAGGCQTQGDVKCRGGCQIQGGVSKTGRPTPAETSDTAKSNVFCLIYRT